MMASHAEDPKTSRLYYVDARLREFTAEVLASETSDTGAPVRLRLSQTAFYPTSGGQPHDTGTLNGVPVIEVIENDDGEIWHVLAQPLSPETKHVQGQIDWTRRFDHMQQHTGQHMLSAAFDDLVSASTVGFHMGDEASTIDLDTGSQGELAWDRIFEVEVAVNQVIWENRPIRVRIVSEDEVARVTLRKPPAVTGDIRVIEVAGYDASACGGTHVAATGEIGIVKITGLERYKGGVRITFLAGQRALHHYQQHLQLLQVSSLALTVGPRELPQAIARLEESAKSAKRDLRQLREELLTYETERLWAHAPVVNNTHVVARLSERTFAEARALASALREHPATFVLLAVLEQTGTRLVCARSDDLDRPGAQTLLQDVLERLGGRGGGTPTLAQGGAPAHSKEHIRRVLEETLRHHDLLHADDYVD